MKRGASQGSHWVWETRSPVQSDDAVNLHPSRALEHTDAASSSPIARFWGRDVSSWREWTQPLHRAYGVGGPHKTTTLITVLLAASAVTAKPTSEFELDLRYL